MNTSTLRTGWVCIATEGTTVDGREITAAWLTDMAETYDPEYYTALIWPEHDRWANFGYVQELKTDMVDGKLKLFAILSPTRDLVYYNQVGQYQFCSIEPQEQFADLGRTYLRGLGVTDEPASTGTTHLKFKKKGESRLIGTSEPLDLSTFKLPKHEKADGLIAKFFSFLASHGEQEKPSTPSQSEDEEMTKEQFDLLQGTLTGLGEKIESFSAKLETKQETETTAPATTPTTADDKIGISADQFTKLEQSLTSLSETVGSLKGQLDKFSAEVPGQRPGNLGGNDTTYQVC